MSSFSRTSAAQAPRRPSAWRVAALTVAVLVVIAGALYGLRVGYLFAFDDELPASPGNSLPAIPASVHVVEEGQRCASGGCWWEIVLEAPAGLTLSGLAAELGVDEEHCTPGDFWDPREHCVGSLESGGHLVVYDSRHSLGYSALGAFSAARVDLSA